MSCYRYLDCCSIFANSLMICVIDYIVLLVVVVVLVVLGCVCCLCCLCCGACCVSSADALMLVPAIV